VKYADKTRQRVSRRSFRPAHDGALSPRVLSDFFAYLQNFPPESLKVRTTFSMVEEKFGLKPVISITHVFLYRPSATDDV
jgi:hypothetical protein